MNIHVGITNAYEHIFIFTAPIRLACTLKLNGRDKSNITLNQDETTTFIAKADQNNDAVNTAGLYSWVELITEMIKKNYTNFYDNHCDTNYHLYHLDSIYYIKRNVRNSHSLFLKSIAKYIYVLYMRTF